MRPDAFPSCFGDYGAATEKPVSHSAATATSSSSSSSSSSKMSQNLITCLYQTKLAGIHNLVAVTWCKNLMGQGLSLHVNDPSFNYLCKVDMKPWFFWKKQGCKSFDVNGKKMEVFWDLANAKYCHSPEPQEGYYVALVYDKELILVLGDMLQEAHRRTHGCKMIHQHETTLLARREHVFGKKYYTTKAQIGSKTHEIVIECHTAGPKEPRLYVRVGKQVVLQVKHLVWKFRGNQTIEIEGTPIQIFWDVHNWLFNPTIGHAVFMFQTTATATAAASSSSSSSRFPCNNTSKSSPLTPSGTSAASFTPSPSSVLQWPSSSNKSIFKSSSSSSSSPNSTSSSVLQWASSETELLRRSSGFSLLLYAWKSE